MKKQIKNSLINMLLNKNVFKRPLILVYVIFFSLFFNSCDKKIADIPDSNIEKGELAVEIFNHSPCLNKIEFLSEAKHPDFLSPEIKTMAQSAGVYRYLETDMHTNFAGMVGTNSYELRTYCTQQWVTEIPMSIKGADKKIGPTGSNNGHWETVCYTSYVPVTMEHDGILSSNAVIVPTSKGVKIANIRVPGVNHQEMGNHAKMRALFNEIFNGTTYDQVFRK